MDDSERRILQNSIAMITDYFGGIPDGEGKVEFWEALAAKLSHIVGQEPPWGWRYPQGVYTGSIKTPSKKFAAAVYALGAALDEVPTVLAYTVEVRVFAKPGAVDDGALIIGQSKPCARPGCRVRIVPNVPWRKFCSDECARLDREQRTK